VERTVVVVKATEQDLDPNGNVIQERETEVKCSCCWFPKETVEEGVFLVLREWEGKWVVLCNRCANIPPL
jgi:hypothetical protein